ncbi:hypothetical protein [Sphingomonas sp. LHG3443-2]|uniref:hypothetical protein n=1 Tax=Sphingomonas sp. LHG3443-2 TaxID=2804639 RepID=UPI003CFA09AE
MANFSEKLLSRPEARSADALKRISIAKNRIQSVLDRERVAHQKTLEQKISDQGPVGMRVDPHLVGLAIMDLLELNRLKTVLSEVTGKHPWYANRLTSGAEIDERLETLAPLYQSTLGNFSNLIGDALEVITEKCLAAQQAKQGKYVYQGHFLLDEPKDKHGRYKKIQPPKAIGPFSTQKEADFLQFGYDDGALCIECKNYREWIYPHSNLISELIVKALELGSLPLMVARRIHYTTRENLFKPAGIMFHETFYQYYPVGHDEITDKVKDKTLLGFSDVRATEQPDKRTSKFFSDYLPTITAPSALLWNRHKDALKAYTRSEMDLMELYKVIGSPGARVTAPVPF